jgi:hypothetical protein
VHSISNVRQTEVHTAEPSVPGLSCLEVEIVIAELKKYRSPDSDELPVELIKAGGEILLSEFYKLISSIWNEEELSDQCKEAISIPILIKGE